MTRHPSRRRRWRTTPADLATRVALGALATFAVVGIGRNVAHPTPPPATPETVTPATAAQAPACPAEDMPCWDCRTMGNRICGPARAELPHTQ